MDKVNDDDDSEDSEDSYGEGLYGSSGAGYATKNLKSFRHYTREALPRADHYRNVESVHGFMARPTLDELHGTQATVSFDSNTVCLFLFLNNKLKITTTINEDFIIINEFFFSFIKFLFHP